MSRPPERASDVVVAVKLTAQLALQHFESTFKFFSAGAEADTLHSWSTQLLPYLEQDGLHQRIDGKVSWDTPENTFETTRVL